MKKSLIILVLFLLGQVVCGALVSVWLSWKYAPQAVSLAELPSAERAVAFGCALFFVNVLLVALLWIFRLIRRRDELPRPLPPLRGWPWALLAVLSLLSGLSLGLLPLDLDDGGMTEAFSAMRSNPLCLLSLCLVGPVTEELLFREGIQRHLTMKWPPAAALFVSAAVFAAVHGNWAQGVPAFLFGCLFGFFFLRGGDVRISALGHILNNTLGVLLLLFPQVEVHLRTAAPVWLVGSGILLCAVAVVFSMKWAKKQE